MTPARSRLMLALFLLALTGVIAGSQDAPGWKLTAVTDPLGQPFPVPADKRGVGPGLLNFDSPYLLQNKTDGLAIWYVHGGRAFPVSFEGGKAPKRVAAPEIVNSGGTWILTYVLEGGNEFWVLDAEQAGQVKHPDGKVFSQRSYITRGGEKAMLYLGSHTGKTQLYELAAGVAKPITIADKTDHGTAQYAWYLDGRLLVAFYMAGTHDFYWLKDGTFSACWDRNGNQDYDTQIDAIHSVWWNQRLFLNLVRRDNHAELWSISEGELNSASDNADSWSRPGAVAVGRDGVYFIGDDRLQVTDGVESRGVLDDQAEPLLLDAKATLSSRGGGVLVTNETGNDFTCWLVSGKAQLLGTHKIGSAGRYVLVASAGEEDLVRCVDGSGNRSWKLFTAGAQQAAEVEGVPEYFGNIDSAWSVQEDGKAVFYAIERKEGAVSFRLWKLLK